MQVDADHEAALARLLEVRTIRRARRQVVGKRNGPPAVDVAGRVAVVRLDPDRRREWCRVGAHDHADVTIERHARGSSPTISRASTHVATRSPFLRTRAAASFTI